MLKALHTVVFHFLARPGHLDISAVWWLWISVCHQCQSIIFISEIPFVQPVGTLLRFHAGWEGTSKWQTSSSWILMRKWPSCEGRRKKFFIQKNYTRFNGSAEVGVYVCDFVCLWSFCGPLIKTWACTWQRSAGSVGQPWVALSLTLTVLIMDD